MIRILAAKVYICENFLSLNIKNSFVIAKATNYKLYKRKQNIKMKTTASFFTKITLGLLVVGTIAACGKKSTDTATSTTPPSSSKEAIVYINSDSLLSKYEYAKDMGKRLESSSKSAQNDVASRGQSLEREFNDYKRNAATMPADQRQKTEERLGREQQDFQQYQQRASADLQSQQNTENGKLYDKIADFAKAYAKEKGYKLVLTYSKANPTILYGDLSLDVTADVVSKLNDAYSKEKK
jgi:outer membrane protein